MIKKTFSPKVKIKKKTKLKLSTFQNLVTHKQVKKNYRPLFLQGKKDTKMYSVLKKRAKRAFQVAQKKAKEIASKKVAFLVKKILCRRGFRHRSFLPTRGQKTKANGQTRKKLRRGKKNYPLIKSKAKKNAKKKPQTTSTKKAVSKKGASISKKI